MSESKPCCAMCGFWVRRNIKTGALEPCTQDHRGWKGFDPYGGDGMPYCGRLEHDLEAEWKQQLERLRTDSSYGGNLHRAAVSAVAFLERRCPAFRPWDPLRSPQEHEEMAFAERIQSLCQQQRTEDLARQEEFCASQKQWQREIAALAGRAYRLAVTALIVAVLAAVAAGILLWELAP